MELDETALHRRAEIARRLKAARWLAGGVRRSDDERGKTGWEVYALSTRDLAARPGMAENQLTASKIGTIERMERHTPPMELVVLARALGVPSGWFTIDQSPLTDEQIRDAAELLPRLLEAAQALQRGRAPGAPPPDEQDPPDGVTEAAGG